MSGYFCIGVIGFMLEGKTDSDFNNNLFSPNCFTKKMKYFKLFFMTNVLTWLNAIPLKPWIFIHLSATV